MPGGDRTGPFGQGPKTGRGAGFCAGVDAPGYMSAGQRRGFGRGAGTGRGFGRGARWAGPQSYQAADYAGPGETAGLKEELAALKKQIEILTDKLSGLGSAGNNQ